MGKPELPTHSESDIESRWLNVLSTVAALRLEPWRATHAGSFTPSFCVPAFQPAASSPVRLPRHTRCGTLVRMNAISIRELHENTDLWVRKATEQEPIVLTDKGQAVAKLSGGTDSTQIVAEMRDGR